MKFYLSRSLGYYYDLETRDVHARRQSRWKVSTFEHQTVYDLKNDRNVGVFADCRKTTVRSLMIRSTKARRKDRNVLIHVHGGGFVSQSPETHSYYLSDWAQNLKSKSYL